MLKQIYLFLFSALIFNTTLVAQNDFTIREETTALSSGSFNALVLELDGKNQKLVAKAWKKFAKRYKGKTKYNRKSNEYFSDEATVQNLSDNTVDIYTKISEQEEKTFVYVAFNLGVTYLSSAQFPERYPIGQKVVTDFGYYVSADLFAAQIKAEEKQLRREKRDVKKIENKRKKYERKIEKAKRDIEKNEKQLEQSKDSLLKESQEVETIENSLSEQKEALKQAKKLVKKR